jgi:hypothetical protein
MFKIFKQQIQARFQELTKNGNTLFITNIDKDILWETYLNSFTDPVERQEHTCNCCRQFIKNYGNVVAIIDNEMQTLWNVKAEKEFKKTAKDLNALVLSSTIRDVFMSDTKKIGTDTNDQKTETGYITWNHFSLEVPKESVNNSSYSVESILGTRRDNRNVFKRSLEEISIDAIETVLELIAQNSLYRGQEFQAMIAEFLKYKKAYTMVANKENYCWSQSSILPQAISKIRNSAIGTLLIDISEGKDLDHAVSAFERMVAPQNYKRPNAIITKSMIEDAEKTISELGLSDSLQRRFANKDDISIDKLLFVNRDTKKAMGVFEELKEEVSVNPKSLSKVEEVSIDTFVNDILPNTKSIEVLFENNHLNNLVSIVTEKEKDTPLLFKWNNPISWSYTNAVTDSIKEQVKAAGGKVEGELRTSLSWNNHDDLDLHVIEPNGRLIYFRQKLSPSGGNLDVDMNAGHGTTRTPVENIIFPNSRTILEGSYKILVNNFSKREDTNTGFTVEVECKGEVFTFEHNKPIRDKETVTVVEFTYSKKDGIKIDSNIKSTVLSKEKWNIATNKFQKVSIIMNSPNYWEDSIGNKHYFFILENAKTDESPRGFFNEFLKEDLLKNKRVFEVLGSKLKVEPSDRQLSGLGFSSTQKNHLICRVEGKFKRLLKVNF